MDERIVSFALLEMCQNHYNAKSDKHILLLYEV